MEAFELIFPKTRKQAENKNELKEDTASTRIWFTAPDDCSRRRNGAGAMSSTSTREIKLCTVEAPKTWPRLDERGVPTPREN